jgi:hypothetical protein
VDLSAPPDGQGRLATGAERGAAPGGSGRERRRCGSGENQETTMAWWKGEGRKRGRYQREVRGRWMSHRGRLVLHRRETEPSHTVYSQFTSSVTGSACCLSRQSPLPLPPPTLVLGLKLCRSACEHFFSTVKWSFFPGRGNGRKVENGWDFFWSRPNWTVLYVQTHSFDGPHFSGWKIYVPALEWPNQTGPQGAFWFYCFTCFYLKKVKAESKTAVLFEQLLQKFLFYSIILKVFWEVFLLAVGLTFWYRFKIWQFFKFKILCFFKFEISNLEKSKLFNFEFLNFLFFLEK